MKKLMLITGLITMMGIQVVFSATAEADFGELMNTSSQLMQKVYAGDKDARKEVQPILEQALKLNPKHPLINAQLGIVVSMQAGDAFFPWSKMSKVNKGIQYLDYAVKLAPENAGIRYLRGRTYCNFPSFLNKRDVALKDMYFVVEQYESAPETCSRLQAAGACKVIAALEKDTARAQAFKVKAAQYSKQK